MRYENIYSSFPCPASGHFSAASGRVAPIRGSVLYLRLVVAFGVALFSDFVNASPNQMTQLTDFQYALCDGAGK